MKVKNKNKFAGLGKIFLALIVAAVMLGLVWPAWKAQANGLPPRGQPPGVQPQKAGDDSDDGPIGTYIELQTQPAVSGLWAVIQWQDQQGDWHNVEGWQGAVDENGAQRWWVDQKDFATGPFRWVISQDGNGTVLSASDVFNLPAGANQNLLVIISLE